MDTSTLTIIRSWLVRIPKTTVFNLTWTTLGYLMIKGYIAEEEYTLATLILNSLGITANIAVYSIKNKQK